MKRPTSQDCARQAFTWAWQLQRLAKADKDARRMLQNSAVSIVEMAVSSNDHVAFQSAANAFLVAAHGKKPTQSNSFCEEWLLIGLMHKIRSQRI